MHQALIDNAVEDNGGQVAFIAHASFHWSNAALYTGRNRHFYRGDTVVSPFY